MSRKILGLDIRSGTVSAVLLNSGSRGSAIEAFETVPISGETDFKDDLSAAVGTIVEKIDVTDAVCVASFPAERLFYRNVHVPFKEPKKIRQILPFELEPTLPQAVDDLIIDFQTLILPDHTGHTDIMTAAVIKADLAAYLDALSALRIEPDIVTVGGYPAALCLTHLTETAGNYLFVDIGRRQSTVFAILSGEICFIRSFPIRFETSSENELLAADIRHTRLALEELLDLDFKPQNIFVTGRGLDRPGFLENLSQSLNLPVQSADLTASIQVAKPHQPEHPWHPFQMDNALALALMAAEGINGLNLRQGPFVARRFWGEYKNNIIKTGIVAALVLALAFFNVLLDVHLLNKKLNSLNRQITAIFTSTFPAVKTVSKPYEQMQIKIETARKNALIPESEGGPIRVIDLLNDISRLIPTGIDVNLTKLAIGPESIAISGDTNTFKAVDEIKNRLGQSLFFKKIIISSANTERSDSRVRFKLRLDL